MMVTGLSTFCSKYSSSSTDSDNEVSITESLLARRHLIMMLVLELVLLSMSVLVMLQASQH